MASNYSGINGIFANPANLMLMPHKFELNLVAGSSSLDNNMISLPDGVGGFVQDAINEDPIRINAFQEPVGHMYFDYNGKLPSLAIRTNHFAVAGFYQERGGVYARKIPIELANRAIQGVQTGDANLGELDLRKFQAAGMFWREFGGHFSRPIKQYTRERIDAGINAKLLYGWIGTAVQSRKRTGFTITDSNLINISEAELRFGEGEEGWGFAVDLGINVIRRENGAWFKKFYTEADTFDINYKYRLGFSALDVGWIKFQKSIGQTVNVADLSFQAPSFDPNTNWNIDNFENAMLGAFDQVDTLVGIGISPSTSFTMRLPIALHAEFDWHFAKHLYLYNHITYGLPAANIHGLRRPSVIGVTPRFQQKKFEFSLPISLWDFKQPRVGAMMRIGAFSVGTDRLYALKKTRGVSGYDIYMTMAIKIDEVNLEHSMLKPPVKRKPITLPDIRIKLPSIKREMEDHEDGYFETVSSKPGLPVNFYYSGENGGSKFFPISNLNGDSVGRIWARAEYEHPRRYRPWKWGFGYKITSTFKIPREWKSDIYFANGDIPIVVPQRRKTAQVLILVPTNTIVGDNKAGGRSLHGNEKEKKKPGNIVSFLRPVDANLYRQIAPLARALDTLGISYAYITDVELESNSFARGASAVIVAGNSHHWTREARKNMEKSMKRGTNFIVFSKKFQKWHVRYKFKGKQLVCFKRTRKDPLPNPLFKTGSWDEPRLEIPRYPEIHDSVDFRAMISRKVFESYKKPPVEWGYTKGVVIPDTYEGSEYWLEVMRPDGTTETILLQNERGYVLPFLHVKNPKYKGDLYLFDSPYPMRMDSPMHYSLLRALVKSPSE